MENQVYERDYSKEIKVQAAKTSDTDAQLFNHVLESEFFQKFDSAMKAMPKYVVPEDKEAYEDLLPRLDAMAKHWGGKIKGVIDHEKWQANITVILPFFECTSPDDFALLADIAAKTHLVTIKATDDGKLCLNIMINYFAEAGDPDDLINELMVQDDKLMELLEKKYDEEKAEMLHNPAIASFIEREAAELGITAEEYLDRFMQAFNEDPEGFMLQVLGSSAPIKDLDDIIN